MYLEHKAGGERPQDWHKWYQLLGEPLVTHNGDLYYVVLPQPDQMKVAEEVMRDDRDLLRKLAE